MKSNAGLDPLTAPFDDVFRATARRVLTRHGIPADRIEAEIERLRELEPAFSGPTLEDVVETISGGGTKR
ncbi:MAG: hypothetical protein JO128_19025 [Alphaproteobacteria bacterium]|nr:hypothetical protein [Alphaproteobacteria bacterium]